MGKNDQNDFFGKSKSNQLKKFIDKYPAVSQILGWRHDIELIKGCKPEITIHEREIDEVLFFFKGEYFSGAESALPGKKSLCYMSKKEAIGLVDKGHNIIYAHIWHNDLESINYCVENLLMENIQLLDRVSYIVKATKNVWKRYPPKHPEQAELEYEKFQLFLAIYLPPSWGDIKTALSHFVKCKKVKKYPGAMKIINEIVKKTESQKAPGGKDWAQTWVDFIKDSDKK